jgi:hypothetical protein
VPCEQQLQILRLIEVAGESNFPAATVTIGAELQEVGLDTYTVLWQKLL